MSSKTTKFEIWDHVPSFSRSKEETDNVPKNKTEQVTSDIKLILNFYILSYFKKFKQ